MTSSQAYPEEYTGDHTGDHTPPTLGADAAAHRRAPPRFNYYTPWRLYEELKKVIPGLPATATKVVIEVEANRLPLVTATWEAKGPDAVEPITQTFELVEKKA